MKAVFLILFSKKMFIFFLAAMCLYQLNYAQVQIGKIPARVKPNVLLDLDDPNKALLLNRVKNPLTVIGSNAYPGMIVYDSSVNKLAYYNGTSWIYPSDGINILMKKFNPNFDDLVVVDSIGRLMKVDVVDFLNASTAPPSFFPEQKNFTWTRNVPFWEEGLLGHTYGMFITPSYERNPNAWVRTTNFIGARDSILIKLDVYPGTNTGYEGGFYLRLFEYADALGTLIKLDTVVTFVNSADQMGPGISYMRQWNYGLSYPVKLNSNTKFVKIDFLSSAYDSKTSGGRFFENVSLQIVNKPKSIPFYINGGNSFGTTAILGTKDKNNLNLITNNTTRMTIDANTGIVNIPTRLDVGMLFAPANNTLNVLGNTNISNLNIGQEFRLNSTLPLGDIDRDEVLVIDTTLQRQVKKIPTSSFKTIYNSDGTLTGNRTIDMAGKSLFFANGGVTFKNVMSATNIFMNASGNDASIFYLKGLYGNNDLALSGSKNGPHIYITNGGNVGIGTTSPAYKLDVNGDAKCNTLYTSQIQGISDERLKKEISPIQGALAKILQLQGVTYTWRKDMEKQAGYIFKTGTDYGVIAQEIQKILPELVQKDAKGFLTVDYVHITPVLIEAMKEQEKEIEGLKNEVQELKIMIQQIQQSIKK